MNADAIRALAELLREQSSLEAQRKMYAALQTIQMKANEREEREQAEWDRQLKRAGLK